MSIDVFSENTQKSPIRRISPHLHQSFHNRSPSARSPIQLWKPMQKYLIDNIEDYEEKTFVSPIKKNNFTKNINQNNENEGNNEIQNTYLDNINKNHNVDSKNGSINDKIQILYENILFEESNTIFNKNNTFTNQEINNQVITETEISIISIDSEYEKENFWDVNEEKDFSLPLFNYEKNLEDNRSSKDLCEYKENNEIELENKIFESPKPKYKLIDEDFIKNKENIFVSPKFRGCDMEIENIIQRRSEESLLLNKNEIEKKSLGFSFAEIDQNMFFYEYENKENSNKRIKWQSPFFEENSSYCKSFDTSFSSFYDKILNEKEKNYIKMNKKNVKKNKKLKQMNHNEEENYIHRIIKTTSDNSSAKFKKNYLKIYKNIAEQGSELNFKKKKEK